MCLPNLSTNSFPIRYQSKTRLCLDSHATERHEAAINASHQYDIIPDAVAAISIRPLIAIFPTLLSVVVQRQVTVALHQLMDVFISPSASEKSRLYISLSSFNGWCCTSNVTVFLHVRSSSTLRVFNLFRAHCTEF